MKLDLKVSELKYRIFQKKIIIRASFCLVFFFVCFLIGSLGLSE